MINKHNLTDGQNDLLKKGIDLIFAGLQTIKKFQYDENIPDAFIELTDRISDIVFRLEEYEIKPEYHDFSKKEIYKELTKEMQSMTEADEVKMTVDMIESVLHDEADNRKHVTDIVWLSKRNEEAREFYRWAFSDEFIEKYMRHILLIKNKGVGE